MAKSSVIVLSGGMDSSVLAHQLSSERFRLKAITFLYGQKHASKEVKSASVLAEKLKIEHRILDLRVIADLFGSNSLTDIKCDVPSGHYTAESMKSTVVPNRNMIMLSIAAAWAIALKYQYVAYAAHAGDHTIYPDCRPEFAEALNSAIELADWHKVSLLRPFVSLSKAEICKIGQNLDVDFKLTWSCYRGGELHCGSCGTCIERKEAFKLACITDPTNYLDKN